MAARSSGCPGCSLSRRGEDGFAIEIVRSVAGTKLLPCSFGVFGRWRCWRWGVLGAVGGRGATSLAKAYSTTI